MRFDDISKESTLAAEGAIIDYDVTLEEERTKEIESPREELRVSKFK